MRRTKGRRALARPTAIGVVIALLIVAIVIGWSLRGVLEGPEAPPRIADAEELIGPDPLTAEERVGAATGIDAQTMVRLESGAWVEVANPVTGRLAQRYSASRVEPLPDQWVKMEQPRANFHTGGGRIVTLRGDTATARVPRRAIESGRVEGSVVVHVFRPGPDGRIDLQRDRPAIEILAEEADYDSTIGQLRCDGRVEIRTVAARFVGRGLTLLLDGDSRRAEELVVDEALEPVTIDLVALRGDRDEPTSTTTPRTASSARTASERAAASNSAPPPGEAAERPTRNAVAERGQATTPIDATELPYRLTLHDDVVVRRHRDGVVSTVTGDELSLIFAIGGDGPGRELIGARPLPEAPSNALVHAGSVTANGAVVGGAGIGATGFGETGFGATPLGLEHAGSTTDLLTILPTILPLVSTATLDGRAVDDQLRHGGSIVESDLLEITYSGRLVMVETDAPDDRLLTPDETIIEIVGAPVRFEEPSAGIRGRCEQLRYRTANGRLDLIGTPGRTGLARSSTESAGAFSESPGLFIESTQGELAAERLWLIREQGEGRIEGAGRMSLREQSDDAAVVESAADSIEIRWTNGVDFAFEPGVDEASSGRLREAHFREDVDVNAEEFVLRSSALRIAFGDPEEGSADGPGGGIDSSISAIEATGGVAVDRLGAGGSMTCETLHVSMQTHEGRSMPRVMTATERVVAIDEEQTIWSDRVEVTFRPRVGAVDIAEDDRMGGAEVHTVDAAGDVRVRMRDGALVFADQLEGDAIEGRLRLSGDDVMLVRDEVVADRMSAVRFDDGSRAARADGPGRFRVLADALIFDDATPLRRPGRETIANASGGAWDEGQVVDLQILWTDGVDLLFAGADDGDGDRTRPEVAPDDPRETGPATERGRLREARFHGNVRVTAEEFAMRSDELRIVFGGEGELDESIAAIEAIGGVAVDRLGAGGTMTCGRLHVSMQTHDGRSIPHVMTATERVVARDEEQTIWSERVEVIFRPRAEASRSEPDDRLGGAEVHLINADGEVRVRMRDGALVFADRLEGDAIARRLRLTGEDVMLLRDRVVADRMTAVRFDETARTARAEGPGRFRLLAVAPILDTTTGRGDAFDAMTRPALESVESEVVAQWNEAMLIDEVANDGAGSIDLRGDVHVVAEPDAMRRDTLRAEILVLELRHREDVSPARAAEPDEMARTRELARMIARTDADLQSRRWLRPDRSDTPRLFRIRGQHVEHDTLSGESLVVGNGQLLVHDPTPADEPEATGFGRRGTAIFGWKQRMEMRRIVDGRYEITMEEGVEVLHEGVAVGDELTLTTDRLEATIDRGSEGADAPASADAFGLGGPSELIRLRATGVTFVGTPDYRVDCHEFDYDTVSGIARVSARPGRMVRALVTRTASPLQAREMIWDMRLGRLQITQGAGGAMR